MSIPNAYGEVTAARKNNPEIALDFDFLQGGSLGTSPWLETDVQHRKGV